MKRVTKILLGGVVLLVCASPVAGQGAAATGPQGAGKTLFATSDQCLACHNSVVSRAGEDVSIGTAWRATMMAHSARDPYWQAAVRRESIEHAGHGAAIEDECSTCHMPMAHYEARAAGGTARVFAHLPFARPAGAPLPARSDLLAADGVSCTACHQIGPENLGTRESFVGRFALDTLSVAGDRPVYGPFAVDSGRVRLMRSGTGFRPEAGSHVQSSELCATCHTLYTSALDETGRVIGELPEQVPYLEWRRSAYRDVGTSCQTCHMPIVEDSVPVTGVLGIPRAAVNRHSFLGGNFVVLRILNRNAAELGVPVPPHELDAAVRRTIEHLETRAASLSVEETDLSGDRLVAVVRVRNRAGHKLPTAYPSRRAWLHVRVTDRNGATVFESGAFDGSGRIVGNDNDGDPGRFEPHRAEVTRPDQVQIYEAIMVDSRDSVTTGLLRAVRFVKDNRLLPNGFRKEGAEEDIAVRGAASGDPDFVDGTDRVVYRVPIDGAAGPYRVVAELWYQPIAYRWAHNLDEWKAAETDRFVRQYGELGSASAVVLARAAATVPGQE
jgi:hypothetical protein